MGAFISILFGYGQTNERETSIDKEEKAVVADGVGPKDSDATSRACFGAGCYWGTEKYFRYDFPKAHKTISISDTAVGFMGPETAPKNPSYRDVCSGRTGHVEVFEFEFTGGAATYEELVHYFFQFHDPTTQDRQGNDAGSQYASVIYCYDQTQFEIATKVKAKLQALLKNRKLTCFSSQTVYTDIRMKTTFYPAQKDHQDYLAANPSGYCNHRIRFKEWPTSE
jgi:peptide-methionine (S)-S-oxide reductase